MSDVQSLLTVKDLIKDKPVFLKSNNTAFDAAKEMKKSNVTSVLVKDESEHIVGIITELDIVYKIVAANMNPADTEVEKVMAINLLTIEGDESMFKARQMMLDNNVKHLIVTNNDKQIGIVTSKEILGS